MTRRRAGRGTCRPAIRRSAAAASACCCSTSARPTPPTTGPCAATSRNSCPTARVIEEPRWKWWPILNLIILTVRPGRKGKDYAKIWNSERNEGPLKTITRSQAEKLARRPGRRSHRRRLGHALCQSVDRRAGSPTCRQQGCDRILLVPLYPQYAAATTATACDAGLPRADAHALAAGRARGAALLRRSRLHRCAGGLDRAATSPTLDFEPEALIASFHGMPQRYLESGRSLPLPVPEDLAAAARDAGLAGASAGTRRSSRASATSPGCSPTPSRRSSGWRSRACRRLAVVAPGFSADCLETLEELDMENRAAFLANGGEKFALRPLPQRQRARHARHRARRAPRADGLDL